LAWLPYVWPSEHHMRSRLAQRAQKRFEYEDGQVKERHGRHRLLVSHIRAFSSKWIPVRVKKTRQNKRLELRSDSIGTEKALVGLSGDPTGSSAVLC
jgi:hypothetical protein